MAQDSVFEKRRQGERPENKTKGEQKEQGATQKHFSLLIAAFIYLFHFCIHPYDNISGKLYTATTGRHQFIFVLGDLKMFHLSPEGLLHVPDKKKDGSHFHKPKSTKTPVTKKKTI